MKVLNTLAMFCACVALFVSGASHAEKLKWDLSTEYGEHSHHGEGVKMFADRVRERTGGELDISVYYNASLGFRSKDQLDAVADGSVQVADTLTLTLGGVNPIFLLSGIPYLTDGSFEQARILYEVAKAEYESVLEDNNQVLLWATPWPAAGIWSTTPIKNAGDLGELKIRTYDTLSTMSYRDAGAVPVQLSWADVVPQLSTGAINGVLTSIENGLAASFPQLVKYYSDVAINTPLNIVAVNKDAFEDLSPQQQETVRAVAKEIEEYQWANIAAREKKNAEIARSRGVTVISPVSDEFKKHLVKTSLSARTQWLGQMKGRGDKFIEAFEQRAAR